MSRSAFLSSCGDPFLLSLCYKLFRERWYDEVDNLWIDCNNSCGIPSGAIADVFRHIASDKKVHIIYHPSGIGNGRPITEMVKLSGDNHVLLLEDDGFIFDSGYVDELFRKIERGDYDAIGSERFSCGPELAEAMQKKYSLDYTGYGDRGPNYWPNFFFCKRMDLLRTDMDFGSNAFLRGEYYKEADHTFEDDCMGDTFVWACVQLRAMGLRFLNVPQHKADPYETENKEKKQMNWHESQQPFHWIHGGSLSAGWGGYLSGIIPQATDEGSKREMESRCAFWKIAAEQGQDIPLSGIYSMGIEKLIHDYELDKERINKKVLIYKNLLRL